MRYVALWKHSAMRQNAVPPNPIVRLYCTKNQRAILNVCTKAFPLAGTATFACHIHDQDLWLYEFYLSGGLKDKFNTMPEDWGELPPGEKAALRGNAALFARHRPGLKVDAVERYLRNWEDMAGIWDGSADKAYPEDRCPYGDCWQLIDFLRNLGTPYPPESV